MAYNETIVWPARLDLDFPNLRNNDSTAITENERFYAAHFNKARNLAVKAFSMMASTATAMGDGGLQKACIPVSMTVPFPVLFQVGAFKAPANQVPGNVVPFEFVLTKSTDDYKQETGLGGSGLVLQATSLASRFGGLDPIGAKVACSARVLMPDADLYNPKSSSPNHLMVAADAYIGDDTIVVRGAVCDFKVSADAAQLAQGPSWWLSYGHLRLRVAFVALTPQ